MFTIIVNVRLEGIHGLDAGKISLGLYESLENAVEAFYELTNNCPAVAGYVEEMNSDRAYPGHFTYKGLGEPFAYVAEVVEVTRPRGRSGRVTTEWEEVEPPLIP